jgi:hypothetical protein
MPTGRSNSITAANRTPRTLVLCFDGTSESYDPNVTNVVKLYSLLRKDKVEDQLCYYQVSAPFYCLRCSYIPVGGNRNILRAGRRKASFSMGCDGPG